MNRKIRSGLKGFLRKHVFMSGGHPADLMFGEAEKLHMENSDADIFRVFLGDVPFTLEKR